MINRRWNYSILAGALAAGAGLRLWLCWSWVFAGSDSYVYVGLADELLKSGRYALANVPHFARVPIYPLFIALVKGGAKAAMDGGPGWFRIEVAQLVAEVLIELPLVYWLTTRLTSRRIGLAAVWLVALWPMRAIWVGAALTESLAATLTLATLGCFCSRRWTLWWIGGALVGVSTLLRPDGLLLLGGLAGGLWGVNRRVALRLVATALLGFATVYSPWPLRNLATFGVAHWVGSHSDRFGNPIVHDHGYWNWMRSWCRDERCQTSAATCFRTPPCQPLLTQYPAHAFRNEAERQAITALFAKRGSGGLSAEVDAGFEVQAKQNQADQALAFWLALPAQRAYHMWISRHDELLQNRHEFAAPWRAVAPPLFALLWLLGIVGASALLRDEVRRRMAMILVVPLLLRTWLLPMFLYSMPRYAVQSMTSLAILAVIGAAYLGKVSLRYAHSVRRL